MASSTKAKRGLGLQSTAAPPPPMLQAQPEIQPFSTEVVYEVPMADPDDEGDVISGQRVNVIVEALSTR